MKKLISLCTISIIILSTFFIFGLPAYHVYKSKETLQRIVSHGFNETKKIDKYISKSGKFPSVKNMKDAGILGKTDEIAFKFVKKGEKEDMGTLEITTKEIGLPKGIKNQKIFFERTEKGWQCSSLLKEKYRINQCDKDAPPQPVYLG